MARGRAKLAIGQGVCVWVLEAPDGFGDAQFHSHHAIQIAVSLWGALTLASEAECITGQAIGVATDARHRLDAHGLLVLIFVEPESRAGRALQQLLFIDAELARLDGEGLLGEVEPLAATFEDQLSVEDLLHIGRAVVEDLVPGGSARTPDARVQRIIDYAAAHLDQPLTLASASRGVYLSPSRLRHLFVEQTGLAFKTYLLWLRLVRAVQIYSEGAASLTEAAHAAGFADLAHFSRVFKRTFGSPATTLERF
jgi:AraC family transcriptional regulator